MLGLNSKIYVAGHRGLVGSAIVRALRNKGYNNLLLPKRNELDLKNQYKVFNFLKINKPLFIFIAAAKVGGILANSNYPYDFILENLKIQTNIIEIAFNYKVKKLIFLGSSCIYPKFAAQPIKEDALLSNKLEKTNEFYAVAK